MQAIIVIILISIQIAEMLHQQASNSIVLRSVKDISQSNCRTKLKRDLQQIKVMFTNKADIDIRCSPSKFDRKEVEILSVKNLGFKKYINISNLKNNRTIDKVCQYQPEKLGILGQKSKSLNFKNLFEDKILNQRKSTKNSRFLYQHQRYNLKKIPPIRFRPQSITVENLLRKADKFLDHKKQTPMSKTKRAQTQLQQSIKFCQNCQINNEEQLSNLMIIKSGHKKAPKQLKLTFHNSRNLKQEKKLDYSLQNMQRNIELINTKKDSNQQIGPWKTQSQDYKYL